LLKPNIIKG